jgi:hypothetical protein
VVTASLLGCVIVCWLRAAGLLLLASRPVLDQLNDHRWRTGAPLDPRVRWLSTPSIEDSEAAWSWAQVNMMLGAARVRRERIQSAGNLDFHYRRVLPALDRGGASGGLAPASQALPGPPSSVPPMAQRAGKTRVLPRSLSTAPEWLIVVAGAGSNPLAGC